MPAHSDALSVAAEVNENLERRRYDMTRWTPAERAIYDAVQAVECLGADVRLTRAVLMLGQAQDEVARVLAELDGPPPAAKRERVCRCGHMESRHPECDGGCWEHDCECEIFAPAPEAA